ncbi:MAG: alpha/beta hydrolase-fold protein [Eubacteriales bacterium]|nr:alpha/beta hydrolase-fold protein [Eubacteriales bacterium]
MALLEMNYKSEALSRDIRLEILLPCNDGRTDAPTPFRTLYFLPGYSGSGKEILTELSFRPHSMFYGTAVVIVDGENSFYVDHKERRMGYQSFVGQEVVEVTRKLFPLSRKREDTFIGGISMGGFGALYIGVQKADTFGKIAMLSPGLDAYEMIDREGGFFREQLDNMFGGREAFYQNDFYYKTLLSRRLDKGLDIPELFLCCGREDVLVYEQVREMRRFLEEKGIAVEYHEDDGDHDILYWESKMDQLFDFCK